MKRALIIAAVLLVLGISVVTAITGSYDLSWFTVDGGSGASSGGAYTLLGTIGQADSGPSGNGTFSLSGGFWGRKTLSNHRTFLPVVIR